MSMELTFSPSRRVSRAATGGVGLWGCVKAQARATWAQMVELRRLRHDRELLARMDERLLRDIGIERADVERPEPPLWTQSAPGR